MKLEGDLRGHMKIGVALCAAIPFIGLASVGKAEEYTLDSIQLRRSIAEELDGHYECGPRREFYGTLLCDRATSIGDETIADTVIKSSDGSILYAYDLSEMAGDFEKIAAGAIAEISTSLSGSTPRYSSGEGVVLAIWGDTKLEEIATNATEYTDITGTIEQDFGLLVAPTGNLETTRDRGLPLYRVIGGDGLVVIISRDGPSEVTVQRFIVAAGTLAEMNFESQALQFLAQDQANPANDFSNWPDVAFMVRRLALNTTPENANLAVDRIFGDAANRKYYSHVWAVLPTSVIKHLQKQTYQAHDVFGEGTEFPEIRRDIVAQLEAEPDAPFSEFLLYTLGRFNEAVEFNEKSPIHTVLLYALGHSTLRAVLSSTFEAVAKPGDLEMIQDSIVYYSYKYNYRDEVPYLEKTVDEVNASLSMRDFFNDHAYEDINNSSDDYKDDMPSLTQYLNYFNKFPERYNSEPLTYKVPGFKEATDVLLPLFEEVAKDQGSPHFDDAAYMLAWLAYNRGQVDDALDRFANIAALLPRANSSLPDENEDEAEEVEEERYFDYAFMALHHLARIFKTLPPQDVIGRVENSEVLSSHPVVWDVALTTFYHAHQHDMVMSGARRALRTFGVVIEDFPVTTDPRQIADVFAKLNVGDWYLEEIVYLYQSSLEISKTEEMLEKSKEYPVSVVKDRIKEVIEKYSMATDAEMEMMYSDPNSKPRHKDLRQSIYICDRALELLPRTAEYSRFREWLHYKRIRLLAQFDPVAIASASTQFRDEFPQSPLLDDVMAEQVFAEAVIVGDMTKATETFDFLRQGYPGSNALDNAYSWMAIGWTCAGKPEAAQQVDQQILRRFPLTRHALYAQGRIRNPEACGALSGLYLWEYEAMRWRERSRIDAIQTMLKEGVNTGFTRPRESQESVALSEASPKRKPVPTSNLTRLQAIERVSDLFRLNMDPSRQSLQNLSSYYADSVNYYGKTRTNEEVLQDKRKYLDRWPFRYYKLQYDMMQADCSDGQVCSVRGYYDWSVLSTKRLKHEAGAASFEYEILAQPPYSVIRETSEVTGRQ